MCALATGSMSALAGYILFCNRNHGNEDLQLVLMAAFIAESLIFAALYLYDEILSARLGDFCKNTGTTVGMLV